MIKKIKDNYLTISLVGILLIGLSLLLYPTVSDYWNSFHQSEAVAGYVQDVEDMSEQKKSRDVGCCTSLQSNVANRGYS